MTIRRAIIFILTALFALAASYGQELRANSELAARAYARPIPELLFPHFSALGNRMMNPDKKKTVYIGQIYDARGSQSRVRVTQQLPDLVRLDGFKADQTALSFDGENTYGVQDQEDEKLLELFAMDFPEGLLKSVEGSAAVRLIGRRFGPDPDLMPDYKGPRYDVYDISAPVRSREDKAVRAKLYYFDSDTGLLASTRYAEKVGSNYRKIETRFNEWFKYDGSFYPSRIERLVDKKVVLTFIVESIGSEPGDSGLESFRVGR